MPSSKKSKKEKAEDKKQTSLFSFSTKNSSEEKSEPHKKKKKEKSTHQEKKEEQKQEKKQKVKVEFEPGKISIASEEIKPEEKYEKLEKRKEKTEIPEEKYFEDKDQPFGLKKGDIELEKIKRENFTSRYIRYLIESEQIVENLEKGLLLDVDYDGGQNKAYCKFYDLVSHDIKIWIDTTGHEPYCLSKKTVQELESNIDLTNYEGFERFEEINKIDLLHDVEIPMTKIYGKTPTDIGGSGNNIRNIIKDAWEANIRYHLNYIYDRTLIPGLVYKIENGVIKKISYKGDEKEYEKTYKELINLFDGEKSEIQEFAEKNLELFLTPIPDVKRMALDIEVMMGPNQTQIPDPKLAKREIISVSFVATDGLKIVYVLEREDFDYGTTNKEFPADAEIIFFKSERKLIEETFRLIWEYPVIITFNGDNFDLNYLFHRAKIVKVPRDLNPIQVKRGYGFLSKAECYLRKGIHLDLFNFFFNRSISGYAFGGAYESASLESISNALLGGGKFLYDGEIHDLDYCTLAWYNLKDSMLTLELTKFNNSLVWNLIILLCRITKMPIHDMIRHQISSWIQNILFYEHRQQNYLIPNSSDIREMKQGGYSKSTVEGKLFQGAYVVPPIPGIHFDVVVMDFSSLYPTIIKEYNLSYETVLCPHNDCRDNLVKGIPYHICTHKMGIFAYVTGFLRDVRVKYFKPKSSDKSLSEERRSYNLTIQQALKVFINGSYGVFGSQNFQLFCLPVAESTTGIGQYSLKSTIAKAESMGVRVLYGDTDSVFLESPTEEQMKEISEWSKKELDLDLEAEKTYQFLALSERKKNYIGIYEDTQYVDMKGLLAKKRNTPEFIKKIFSDLIKILKNITNQKEFKEARDEIMEIVRKNLKKIGKKGAFELEDYAINIGMTKSLDKYNKTTPQHVKAALELREVIGKETQRGETVSFIKSKTSDGVKALELAKLQDIDVRKYKELLKSALEQVLDALGISFEEIKGIKKMDAFF